LDFLFFICLTKFPSYAWAFLSSFSSLTFLFDFILFYSYFSINILRLLLWLCVVGKFDFNIFFYNFSFAPLLNGAVEMTRFSTHSTCHRLTQMIKIMFILEFFGCTCRSFEFTTWNGLHSCVRIINFPLKIKLNFLHHVSSTRQVSLITSRQLFQIFSYVSFLYIKISSKLSLSLAVENSLAHERSEVKCLRIFGTNFQRDSKIYEWNCKIERE
jgi:hypothetical protein